MGTRDTLRHPPPVLVCVDMQQEYLSPGRRHAMADTTEVLATCTTLLAQWRSRLWPILHLKRVARSAWFNPASTLTDWLPAFRPRPGEMTFEHPLPSAYSSARFNEYISHVGVTTCMLLGFSLEETVLATVVERFHRGRALHVIEQAVAFGVRRMRPPPVPADPADTDRELCRGANAGRGQPAFRRTDSMTVGWIGQNGRLRRAPRQREGD
jgi:nicotinamidase-related amidase